MKLVARFLSSGIAIYYAAGVFYIDGNGPISRRRLSKLEKEGGVIWLDEETHEQFLDGFRQMVPAEVAEEAVATPGRAFDVRSFTFGIALIFVLALGAIASDYTTTMRASAIQRDSLAYASRLAAVRVPVQAATDIVAATKLGMTHDVYAFRASKAARALAGYKAEDAATAEIVASLKEANRLYAGADAAWQAALTEDPAAYAAFKSAHPDLGLVPGDAPDAVQQLWARAEGQVQEALAGFEAYEAAGPS